MWVWACCSTWRSKSSGVGHKCGNESKRTYRVPNTDSHVVLDQHNKEPVVASRTVGVFSSTTRSSDKGPQQVEVVVNHSDVPLSAAGPASGACVVAGSFHQHTHTVVGARANCRHRGSCGGPDWQCALLRPLYFTTSTQQWRLVTGWAGSLSAQLERLARGKHSSAGQ